MTETSTNDNTNHSFNKLEPIAFKIKESKILNKGKEITNGDSKHSNSIKLNDSGRLTELKDCLIEKDNCDKSMSTIIGDEIERCTKI